MRCGNLDLTLWVTVGKKIPQKINQSAARPPLSLVSPVISSSGQAVERFGPSGEGGDRLHQTRGCQFSVGSPRLLNTPARQGFRTAPLHGERTASEVRPQQSLPPRPAILGE